MERLKAALLYCTIRAAGKVRYKDPERYEEHLGIWTAIQYNSGGVRWS